MIRIVVHDLYELSQVFFQWEFAIAVAGVVMHLNVFNQPDVEASKIATRHLTEEFERTGSLPKEEPILVQDGFAVYADAANGEALTHDSHLTLGGIIRAQLDRLRERDYFGLLAFLPMFPEYEDKLQEIRKHVTMHKHVATVLGFGPRFLHSTGQAYKGGPHTGVFLQLTCDDAQDLAIPGQKYTFGVVKAAQARGDFTVLAERKRRVMRLHIAKDIGHSLDHLKDLVAAALSH